MCSITFFERDITRDRITILERVVDLGYVLRQELILFLLVPQILGKHTNKLFSNCKSDEVHGVYPWFFEKMTLP